MRKVLAGAVFLLSLRTVCAAARAEPVSVGLTAAVTTGTTNRSHSSATVPVVPVPLLSLRIPMNRFEIFAEGVPPIGPVAYGHSPVQYLYLSNPPRETYWQGTKLSYGYAALRYHVIPTLSLGIGQTLYNQQTTQTITRVGTIAVEGPHGTFPVTYTNVTGEIDASRVPGMRYEIAAVVPISRFTAMCAQLALTPSMHAVIHANLWDSSTTAFPARTFSSTFRRSFSEPETASEVDASIGATRRIGRFKLSWGLRYLNYIARYDATRALADRNTLVLPFIGVERALGPEGATHQK